MHNHFMSIINSALLVLLAVLGCWGYFHLSSALPPKKEPPKPAAPPRKACSIQRAKELVALITTMKANEEWKAERLSGETAKRSRWLAAKAAFALHRLKAPKATLDDEKLRMMVEDTYVMLLKAAQQNDQGAAIMNEEGGGRLRTYLSPIDGTVQTYSVVQPFLYELSSGMFTCQPSIGLPSAPKQIVLPKSSASPEPTVSIMVNVSSLL